jgi:hypothetical protein
LFPGSKIRCGAEGLFIFFHPALDLIFKPFHLFFVKSFRRISHLEPTDKMTQNHLAVKAESFFIRPTLWSMLRLSPSGQMILLSQESTLAPSKALKTQFKASMDSMPAVKGLHQESESNSKPAFIIGHSFQAVGVLAGALKSAFVVPLISRIHEGVSVSNRDRRTLQDKMIAIIESLGIDEPFYFIADAYYASGKIVRKRLNNGNHLITRVKNNAVAYYSATESNAGREENGSMGEKSSSATCSGIRSRCLRPRVQFMARARANPVSLGRSDLALCRSGRLQLG